MYIQLASYSFDISPDILWNKSVGITRLTLTLAFHLFKRKSEWTYPGLVVQNSEQVHGVVIVLLSQWTTVETQSHDTLDNKKKKIQKKDMKMFYD